MKTRKCDVTFSEPMNCGLLPIYIRVRKGKLHRSTEIGDYCIVDLDKAGKVLGIELFEDIYNEGKVIKILESLA